MSRFSNRRDFIGQFAAISGALSLGACKTLGTRNLPASSGLKVSDIDPYIPKRQEFSSLPESDKRAFIEAVREMHTRKLLVPASFGHQESKRELSYWRAQAETHTFFCDHGTWKFLPWHRAYLHVFELHLKKYIRPSFRLPYWDWTVSVDVPLELQSQELLQSLEIDRQAHSLSDDKDLILNAIQEILTAEDFDTIGGDASSSGMIEGPYHNMVHVYLGGHMGRVPTAAQDPIFWLLHCNVDRLWSLWMDKMIAAGKIREMFPSLDVGDWLSLEYRDNFWSPEGKPLSFTTQNSLFTDKLGYNYQAVSKSWDLTDIPADDPVAEVSAPLASVEAATVELSGSSGLRLNSSSAEALRIRFQLESKVFRSPYPLRSLRLKASGIPTPKDPTWTYRVSLEVGPQTLTLADIAFFPGGSHKHGAHSHGSIGINLNRYRDVLRSLAQNHNEAILVLRPTDKKNSPRSLADTFASIPSKSSLGIRLKAVFASGG